MSDFCRWGCSVRSSSRLFAVSVLATTVLVLGVAFPVAAATRADDIPLAPASSTTMPDDPSAPSSPPTDGPVDAPAAPAVAEPLLDGSREPDTASAVSVAMKFGHPVADDSQTTETTQVSAMPDGSFRLESTTLPVRVEKDDNWVPVDTTLTTSGEGLLVPAVAAAPVQFSAGGSDVMAKVEVQPGTWVSETWPYGNLPAPQVDGNDATYSNVLPDVDLQLTATATGMSEVLIVKTAAAAANPKLDEVKLSLDGATITPDDTHALTATADGTTPDASTVAGDAGTMSSAPVWWDSKVSGSGPGGPVGSEEVRPVGQVATPDDVTLKVGALVDTQPISYPLFVDPGWSTGGQPYWFTDRAFPNTVYLNGNADSGGIQAVGYGGPTPAYLSHSFWQFDTNFLHGKHVLGAHMDTYLAWSNTCTSTAVQAWEYGTGSDQPGFTWNQEPNAWNRLLDTKSANYGSSCAAGNGLGFDIAPSAASAAAAGWPNLQIGLRAANENDQQTRKHFATAASITVDFNSIPNKPVALSVPSPARGCGTAANPAFLNGKNQITLQATVTDADSQNLGTAFYVTNSDTGQNALAQYGLPFAGSPSQAQGVQSQLLPSSGGVTLPEGHYSWYAQALDYTDWGPVSDLCYLTIDNTAPPLPLKPTLPATPTGGFTVGTPLNVTLAVGAAATQADQVVAMGYYWGPGNQTTNPPPPPVMGATNPPSCTSAPTQGMRFICPDSTGKATIQVAPIGESSTLYVTGWDRAGNVAALTPTSTTYAKGVAVTAVPDPSVSISKGHQWLTDSLTTILPSIPDKGTTAPQALTIGSGVSNFTADTGFGTVPVIKLPGYVELSRYKNGSAHMAVLDGFAPSTSWIFESALGQMLPIASDTQAAPTNTQKLYSCAVSGEMTSTSSDCEGTNAARQPLGWVWKTPASVPGGSTAAATLTRCYNPVNGDHFVTVTAVDPCAGYSLDSILGYLAKLGVTKTASSAVDTTKAFTVSAYLFANDNSIKTPGSKYGNYTAVSQSNTNTPNSAFYLGMAGGQWRFCVRSHGGTDDVDCVATGAGAKLGAWTLVTGIWDPVNQQIRLLIGDLPEPVSIGSHVLHSGEKTSAGPLVVGSAVSAGSTDNQWNGLIADPAIFPGIISQTQLDLLDAQNVVQ